MAAAAAVGLLPLGRDSVDGRRENVLEIKGF